MSKSQEHNKKNRVIRRIQGLGDKAAVTLSTLCLVHCVATPLLLILLPSLGGTFLGHEAFHLLLLFFVIPVGLIALTVGYRQHRALPIFILGLTGLIILALAALLGHEVLTKTKETLLTVLASFIIVFAHVNNFRLCQTPLSTDHED